VRCGVSTSGNFVRLGLQQVVVDRYALVSGPNTRLGFGIVHSTAMTPLAKRSKILAIGRRSVEQFRFQIGGSFLNNRKEKARLCVCQRPKRYKMAEAVTEAWSSAAKSPVGLSLCLRAGMSSVRAMLSRLTVSCGGIVAKLLFNWFALQHFMQKSLHAIAYTSLVPCFQHTRTTTITQAGKARPQCPSFGTRIYLYPLPEPIVYLDND
jgi:hypothetical protein